MADANPLVDALLAALPCRCARCTPRLASAWEAASVCVGTARGRRQAGRFLANSGGVDVAKAAHLLTDSLLWRHALGDVADPGLHAAVLSASTEGVHSRRDRAGRPVVLVRLGFSDPSKLATEHYNGETGEEGWLRYHVWCNERALDVAEQRVVIMDLANLSKWHLAPGALASLQRMVGLDRRHYPGTVKAYLVLNPPSAVRALFLSAWPAVTSWMDETTLAGVKLLGAVDDAATREELLKHLSEDDLPRHLGGRCAHAVRVHPALRSGFAAVDDEAVAEVPPGQYAVATCAIAAADGAEADGAADGAEDGAAADGAAASSREELFVRCLLYSGYACAGDVSAEWRLADGGVATALETTSVDNTALGAPEAATLALAPPPAGAAAPALLRVHLHNSDGYRWRYFFFERPGAAATEWQGEGLPA